MRLHPFAAACAAALLCSALASCTSGGEPAQDTAGAPVGAAAEPTAGESGSDAPGSDEADESSSPEEAEEEEPVRVPVGWAAESLEADGDELPGVTGGADGETVTASDADELADLLAEEEPLTIEVSGQIDLDGAMAVGSDKTLVGVDGGAEFTGGRLVVDGSDNVVLTNLRVESGGTAVAIRGGARHVWVDGSTFVGGGGSALVAVSGGADHVTLSWNHFRDAEAAVDIGGEDEEPGTLRVTLHHNFFDGTSARNPRVRDAEHVHVFNNYFRSNSEYGVDSGLDANVLVEGNYFQGTALSAASGGEEPGNLVTRNNLLVDSAQPELRGEVPDPPYDYEPDDTVTVPDLVSMGAGVS
ncbi:right-handed parallel beta-helix repeat-containing protein [Nocardiopsis sp. EMB25]|uniref:pectate lyase family protein n=1 Tax=Nocardiopsis TaxID=2013 RepID=UPI0003473898|nr:MULTISPECIES: right-handed parallel beta-helix repeat-containing protein [Nocardiopsis]MCY9782483.1 right-handed parallel beta-helix repeat-containing protein [Nocardiopsis sp. EMB25]